MAKRETNGDVWRAIIEQYNATVPTDKQVSNDFAVGASAPCAKVRRSSSRKGTNKQKDYPGLMLLQLRAIGLDDGFAREVKFHSSRLWRLDLANHDLMIAIECHGGVFSGGRHVRGKGFTSDREKMNAAMNLGWLVFEFTAGQIKSGEALSVAQEAIEKKIAALKESEAND